MTDTSTDPAGTTEGRPDDHHGEAAVVVGSVSKVFGTPKTKFGSAKGREVQALDDVSLTVATGELVSLIGPSGCGKSTLLRIIGDLIEPTSGEVVVNGKPAHRARLDNDYGMAFQQAGLFEWRTVRRNVELPLELQGVARAERSARAREVLDLVKLGDFVDNHPWELSGGMQQRVAIARALVTRPGLLLMDEPFGALDEMTREHMQAELQRIRSELGTTVVFVTHSIPEAVYLADRVVVMSPRPGRLTDVIDVDLGPDRSDETRADPAFFERVTEVRAALRGIEKAERDAGHDPDLDVPDPSAQRGDGW